MLNSKLIKWDDSSWILKLTAIDKRAIARLNADLIPIEAFSTGLADLILENVKDEKQRNIIDNLKVDQKSHYDTLWKYDRLFHKQSGITSPGPSACIRNILSKAGLYIDEINAMLAVWGVLMTYQLTLVYAQLAAGRLASIEPIYASLLKEMAVDEYYFYELSVNYFKNIKKKMPKEQLHRLGLIQTKFIDEVYNLLSCEDEFLSLYYAIKYLGVDFQAELSKWFINLDGSSTQTLFVPASDRLKDSLKDLGMTTKSRDIENFFYT